MHTQTKHNDTMDTDIKDLWHTVTGRRSDNGEPITGYKGCWYIMPVHAVDLHDIYRVDEINVEKKQ